MVGNTELPAHKQKKLYMKSLVPSGIKDFFNRTSPPPPQLNC